MVGLLKITFKHSTAHEVFPRFILVILLVFVVILAIQAIIKAVKTHSPLISFKGKRFFLEHYDKIKLLGTFVLLIAYAFLMPRIGFLISGIVFISLFHILYAGKRDVKSISISIGLSVIETTAIWFIFGNLLDVTLP